MAIISYGVGSFFSCSSASVVAVVVVVATAWPSLHFSIVCFLQPLHKTPLFLGVSLLLLLRLLSPHDRDFVSREG